MAELTDEQRRVLAALAEVNEEPDAPSSSAVANKLGATLAPVQAVIDDLHTRGLVSESLKVTDEGRQALGR